MKFILILALLSLTAACGKEQSVNQPRPQSQAVDVASDNEPEHLGAALAFHMDRTHIHCNRWIES